MIAAKIGNQAAVLRYFAKYPHRSDSRLRDDLVAASASIRDLAGHVRALDPTLAGLRAAAMGIEGRAAAIYWRHVARLLPPEAGFPGRVTRGAEDPVNQAINYVYGMLYGEVWRALAKAGLDPYFGFVHGSERDQGSLVFDLIEEFRAPFADRVVLGLVGRGLKLEIGRHGVLRSRHRHKLARAFARSWARRVRWRGKQLAPAAILDHQAAAIARLVLGRGDYRPFRMRW
jgi:CRISPR-associated protein Cas1